MTAYRGSIIAQTLPLQKRGRPHMTILTVLLRLTGSSIGTGAGQTRRRHQQEHCVSVTIIGNFDAEVSTLYRHPLRIGQTSDHSVCIPLITSNQLRSSIHYPDVKVRPSTFLQPHSDIGNFTICIRIRIGVAFSRREASFLTRCALQHSSRYSECVRNHKFLSRTGSGHKRGGAQKLPWRELSQGAVIHGKARGNQQTRRRNKRYSISLLGAKSVKLLRSLNGLGGRKAMPSILTFLRYRLPCRTHRPSKDRAHRETFPAFDCHLHPHRMEHFSAKLIFMCPAKIIIIIWSTRVMLACPMRLVQP